MVERAKKKAKKIALLLALVLTGAVFCFYLFYWWGVDFFAHSVGFWGVVPFLILLGVLYLIISSILKKKFISSAVNKMSPEERSAYEAQLEKERVEREEELKRIEEKNAEEREKRLAEIEEKRKAIASGEMEGDEQYEAAKNEPATGNEVKCPRCSSTQISANKKGYSVGKAAAGVVLTGGIGLVAGGIGAKKVQITCLKCGKQWMAGKA